MISKTASTWVKSIRPPMKALLVNSPLSASRAPWFKQSWSIFCVTLMPPWHCISITS